jgi:hypothetical protein
MGSGRGDYDLARAARQLSERPHENRKHLIELMTPSKSLRFMGRRYIHISRYIVNLWNHMKGNGHTALCPLAEGQWEERILTTVP